MWFDSTLTTIKPDRYASRLSTETNINLRVCNASYVPFPIINPSNQIGMDMIDTVDFDRVPTSSDLMNAMRNLEAKNYTPFELVTILPHPNVQTCTQPSKLIYTCYFKKVIS